MRDLARQARKNQVIRQRAEELAHTRAQKDFSREVKNIFYFVRDRIRYVRDPRGLEMLQTPVRTLEIESGDCDDKSTLLSALLESVGVPTRFVAIGFRPGKFDHVYVEASLSGVWVALETTEPWQPAQAAKGEVIRLTVEV